jgi:hypothetical protein
MLNPASNPYLAGAYAAAAEPITQNYQNVVLPGITTNAMTSGAYGGSRQGVAQGMASNDYLRQLGNLASTMYGNAYSQGTQQALQAGTSLLGAQQTGQLAGLGAQQAAAQGLTNQALQATGLAPTLNQAGYYDIGVLSGAAYTAAGVCGCGPHGARDPGGG